MLIQLLYIPGATALISMFLKEQYKMNQNILTLLLLSSIILFSFSTLIPAQYFLVIQALQMIISVGLLITPFQRWIHQETPNPKTPASNTVRVASGSILPPEKHTRMPYSPISIDFGETVRQIKFSDTPNQKQLVMPYKSTVLQLFNDATVFLPTNEIGCIPILIEATPLNTSLEHTDLTDLVNFGLAPKTKYSLDTLTNAKSWEHPNDQYIDIEAILQSLQNIELGKCHSVTFYANGYRLHLVTSYGTPQQHTVPDIEVLDEIPAIQDVISNNNNAATYPLYRSLSPEKRVSADQNRSLLSFLSTQPRFGLPGFSNMYGHNKALSPSVLKSIQTNQQCRSYKRSIANAGTEE